MKDKILMVVFVLALGSFLTAALLAVDNFTAPIIERNNIVIIKKSVLDTLEIPYTTEDVEDVFSRNIEIANKEGIDFYISKNRDIAFEISGSGLWGPIEAVIGILQDYETIKAITVIHQEETPGLGGRIGEKEFLDRFKNKKLYPEIKIVPPGKATTQNEVDGITGATMSGKAFESLINEQSKKYISFIKELKE